MRLLTAFCLLLLAMTLSLPVMSAEQKSEKIVRDLPYGEVLFHFYKQDYFTALVQLLIAQEKERVSNHVDDSELLAGGMYLSYGMPEKAEKIFQQLLTEEDPDQHNRAWFYLGKIAYQRGDLQSATSRLDKITAELPGELQGQNRLMHALIAMQLEDYKTAREQLEAWKGDKALTPFVSYNLGVAELKSGLVEEGIERLDELGNEKFDRDEENLLALKDKANLAAGLYLLDQKQSAEARAFIDRVRLDGPLSNQALMAAGWTDIEQKANLPALIPWQVLSERNALDPLVQETLIAVPLALSKAGANGRAAEAYERAIEIFSDEINRLDQSMQQIRSGQFIEYLVAQEEEIELGWMRDLKVTTAAPEPFYMDDLLASHRTQESLKNYRDLWFLKNNLEQWQNSVSAYDDMLSLRWERFQLYVPQAKEKLDRLGLEGYERQYQQLSEFNRKAVGEENWLAFANEDELATWERLEAIQAQLDVRAPGNAYFQSRVNELKQILLLNIFEQWKNPETHQKYRYVLNVPQSKEKLVDIKLTDDQRRYYEGLDKFSLKTLDEKEWLDLATAEQRANWDKLEAIQAQLDAESSQPGESDKAEIQSRVNFFKGIVLWNLNAAQPERRWQTKKQLGIIGEELARTRAFVESITQVMQELPAGFEGFGQRIAQDKEAVTELQNDVERTMSRQADVLVQQALDILGGHRDRLDTLNLKAGFALAQIYDRAANPQLDQVEEK